MTDTVSPYDFRLRACLVAELKKGPHASDAGHLFLGGGGGLISKIKPAVSFCSHSEVNRTEIRSWSPNTQTHSYTV